MKIENESAKTISKIIIINEDGTKEEIDKALIVDYSLNGENIGMNMRFSNLDMEDINNIFLGFSKILNKEG